MALIISILILLIGILIIYLTKKITKLKNISDSFDELIIKFIESNQAFYKEQNKIIIKYDDLLEKNKKLINTISNIRNIPDIIEKNNIALLENIKVFKTIADTAATNNRISKENNNAFRSRMQALKTAETSLANKIKNIK